MEGSALVAQEHKMLVQQIGLLGESDGDDVGAAVPPI